MKNRLNISVEDSIKDIMEQLSYDLDLNRSEVISVAVVKLKAYLDEKIFVSNRDVLLKVGRAFKDDLL